jgi:hypothetical protein
VTKNLIVVGAGAGVRIWDGGFAKIGKTSRQTTVSQNSITDAVEGVVTTDSRTAVTNNKITLSPNPNAIGVSGLGCYGSCVGIDGWTDPSVVIGSSPKVNQPIAVTGNTMIFSDATASIGISVGDPSLTQPPPWSEKLTDVNNTIVGAGTNKQLGIDAHE